MKRNEMSSNIYIVDDDESVCKALKMLLTTFGFEVKTFNSAKSFYASPPPMNLAV
jgi:FixJ family two-component response regulator